MPIVNKVLLNYSGGELAGEVQGRVDLPIYQKSVDTAENFYLIPEGGAEYRTGTEHVKFTRQNKSPRLIPFVFSDEQSYALEFTDKKLRFLYNDSALLEAAKNITGMTNASPGVFTSNAHGFNNGDEVYLYELTYLDNISGQFYTIANKTTNTFELVDCFGVSLDTTAVGAYTSGGKVARVYEIDSPYEERDIPFLQHTQSADTMYLTHRNYKPRKLVRASHTSWTLNTYAITGDPFVSTDKAISGVTKANPGVVTSNAHGFVDDQLIFVESIVGMTELNNRFFTVVKIDANTFSLKTREGVAVDTTGYTTYTSGGTATTPDKYPRACTFTDAGRLLFAGTIANPATMFFSAAPSSGNTDYDNFTQGLTTATSPVTITLAAAQGKVDIIQWVSSTSKYLVVGTYSTVRRVFGASEANSVTSTDANAKPVNAYGSAQVVPVVNGDVLFYVQRNGRRVRSFEYDLTVDGYTTIDRNLVAKHITKSGIKQLEEQQGDPDLIWAVRNDGKLSTLTYKQKEDISGWATHYIAGTHVNSNGVTVNNGKAISMCSLPRPNNNDRVWICVERRINGQTMRSLEYLADKIEFVNRKDFFTFSDTDPKAAEEADESKFVNAVYEQQKEVTHMDMSLFYDGSSYGLAANATMTPGVIALGATGTFTASANVFSSDMVNREIWKPYDELGVGGGRAKITGYTSPTQVSVEILVAFNNNETMPAGKWYLTTNTVKGLKPLEGQTVCILADGATRADATVTNGRVTLENQQSKIRVGLKYIGRIRTLNIDAGGVSGPAASKSRSIVSIIANLFNTLGIRFGTTFYNTKPFIFRQGGSIGSRPQPPFTGIKDQNFTDGWSYEDKRVVFIQSSPVPATVLFADVKMKTSDEQRP